MVEQDPYIYEFGKFRMIPAEHLLLLNGKPVQITYKAFQVLLILVRRSGHLVEKSSLVDAVWGETFVEEGNLAVTISMLRKALGNHANKHKYIETIAKQGYRFVPEVSKVFGQEPEPAIVIKQAPVPAALLAPEQHQQPISELHLPPSFSAAEPAVSGGDPEPSAADFVPLQDTVLLAASGQSPKRLFYPWTTAAAMTSALVFAALILMVGIFTIRARHRTAEASPGTHSSTAVPIQASTNLAGPTPEAYQLYSQGRYFWNKRTVNGLQRSIEFFQRAVLKDPSYADAYAGLADSYVLMASYGVEPTEEAYPNAKTAALKALQIDPSSAEAHASLGMVYFYYEWNWPKAKDEFQRAIHLNPNYSIAHTWYALILSATGEGKQALEQIQIAQELDPVSLINDTEVGRIYYWNREYDKAVIAFRHVIDLDPYFARAHSRLGIAYIAEGDYADAIRELHETGELSGPDPYLDGVLGYAEALNGDTREARKTLAGLLARSRHDQYVPAFSIALICAGLGEREESLSWFAKSYQDRSIYMVYADVDPLLDPVRSDRRFAALMARMQLPEGQVRNQPASAASNDKPELFF